MLIYNYDIHCINYFGLSLITFIGRILGIIIESRPIYYMLFSQLSFLYQFVLYFSS